jgi:hypothetical protein
MKRYARIEGGRVAEIICAFIGEDGNEVPIEKRFTPEFVSSLVDVSSLDVEAGYEFDGSIFTAPVPYVRPFVEEAAKYMAEVRALREKILDRLGGIAGRAQRAGNMPVAEYADAAAVRLLDITKSPDVLAATDIDSLRSAVLAEYKAIAASVPESVRSVFNGVDQ